VNAKWKRFCHYQFVEAALEKAMQLGMPYSTAFNHLTATVDLKILGMKKECNGFIKQEMAQINLQHLGPNYTSTWNYISNNMHLKNVAKQEGTKSKLKNKAKKGKYKTNSDDFFTDREQQEFEGWPKSKMDVAQETSPAFDANFQHRLMNVRIQHHRGNSHSVDSWSDSFG